MSPSSILIIDDEESLLNLFSRFLQMEGHKVTLANSGEEGIDKFTNAPYDLVITDLVMGKMGGLEVLHEIKKVDAEAFVIFVTGRGTLDSAIEAIRFGASDYLLKPCSGAELNIRVHDNLERRRLRKKIKYYENILPVCCICKKIRDDSQGKPGEGEWMEFLEFAHRKRGVSIEDRCCSDCAEAKQI